MPRTDRPNPEKAKKLKSRLVTRYSPQDKLDQRMLEFYKQSNQQNLWKPELKGEFEMKKVASGAVGFIVDQDVSVLDGRESVRVNPFGGNEAEKWASQTVEPWLVLGRKASRGKKQLNPKKIQELRLYGRTWTSVLATRKLWGGKDFDQNKGEKDEIYNARVDKQRKSRFPILWRHITARNTWAEFDADDNVVEVIEIRRVAKSTLEEEFPNNNFKDDDVEITRYYNHKYVALFTENEELQVWEHHLGRLPLTLFESDPMPIDPMNPGERWRGVAYHVLSMVQAMDETLGDIRTTARLEVVGPTVIKQDPELRAAAAGGKPEELKVPPMGTVNLFRTEDFSRPGVAQLNPALIQLLGHLKTLIDQIALSRPSLIGSLTSGESAVAMNRATQQAEVELRAGHRALEEGAADECTLMLRCVIALNEMFDIEDEAIVVRGSDDKHKSREISLKPDKLLEWEPLVQVLIEQNLPVDEGANIVNFKVGTEAGMFSRLTGREMFGKFEDPLGEEDRIKEEQLDDIFHQASAQQLMQRLGLMVQEVGAMSGEQIEGDAKTAPADVQEALAQMSEAEGDPDTANRMRGVMNTSRTGRGQQENAEARGA